MKKYLLVLVFVLIGSIAAYAQNTPKCATDIILKEKLDSEPALRAIYLQQQEILKQQTEARLHTAARTNAGPRVIPVVFHVLLNQAQMTQILDTAGVNKRIVSQLAALNRDYNNQNADLANVPAPFQSKIGNANLVFKLAHRDPQGNSTSGVDIVLQNSTKDGFFVGSGTERRADQGGVNAWDSSHYLNIWVVNITGFAGILGFTISPNKELVLNQVRGITLAYGALGQNYGNQGYFITDADSGRTLTHEVGHFFELEHIWGIQNDCSDDDGVGDTPKQATSDFGCPNFPKFDACTPSGDGIMFMNYMDYCVDRCLLMFTNGQVARMNTSLDNGNSILNESGDLTEWPNAVNNLTLQSELSIYPNPSNGIFTVNTSEQLQRITVVSLTGEMVMQQQLNGQRNIQIDLSDKAKGIYAVQCQYAEGTVTRKINIQ